MTTNMHKLAIAYMTMEIVPPGSKIGSAISFLTDPQRIADSSKRSAALAKQSVDAVRAAKEPNPYKDKTDEEIAGAILDKVIAARKR